MWSFNDMNTKENIEKAAKKSLEDELKRWWSDQEYQRGKNPEHTIIPFLIWKKRN